MTESRAIGIRQLTPWRLWERAFCMRISSGALATSFVHHRGRGGRAAALAPISSALAPTRAALPLYWRGSGSS